MKIFRFVALAIAISLLLGVLAPTLGAQKPATANNVSAQSFNTAALDLPFLSPFLFAASAPVITAAVEPLPNSAAAYSCKLISQKPADWTEMKRRTAFNVKWTLKNTGTKVWGIHSVDVKYRGDTRMHYNVPDLFDLPKNVGLGQGITLALDMVAPKNPGYYVSNWGLYLGSQVFCKFYVIIVVTQ